MKTLIQEIRFNDTASIDVNNYVESSERTAHDFFYYELHDPTTNILKIDVRLLNILQALRNKLNCWVHIESAYRGVDYNNAVGGEPNTSKHLFGMAADIKCERFNKTYISPIHVAYALEDILKGMGIAGGIGTYMKGYDGESTGFNHIDTRPDRSRWVVYKKGTEIGIKDLNEIEI